MIHKKSFYTIHLPAGERVGPHNLDVISVLVGNLLGDGHAERRGNSTRFHLHMSDKNAQYVFWLHRFFADRGYCSPTAPSIKRQIGKQNRVYFSIKFRTFSFKSLNWLHDSFYVKEGGAALREGSGARKRVPTLIREVLTERALAVWIMDDGGRSGDGLKISTEGFSLDDHKVLQQAVCENFSLRPTIQRHTGKYLLYFKKSDFCALSSLVKPYTLPCMYYKLRI